MERRKPTPPSKSWSWCSCIKTTILDLQTTHHGISIRYQGYSQPIPKRPISDRWSTITETVTHPINSREVDRRRWSYFGSKSDQTKAVIPKSKNLFKARVQLFQEDENPKESHCWCLLPERINHREERAQVLRDKITTIRREEGREKSSLYWLSDICKQVGPAIGIF
jgi:hypothetical protein